MKCMRKSVKRRYHNNVKRPFLKKTLAYNKKKLYNSKVVLTDERLIHEEDWYSFYNIQFTEEVIIR